MKRQNFQIALIGRILGQAFLSQCSYSLRVKLAMDDLNTEDPFLLKISNELDPMIAIETQRKLDIMRKEVLLRGDKPYV